MHFQQTGNEKAVPAAVFFGYFRQFFRIPPERLHHRLIEPVSRIVFQFFNIRIFQERLKLLPGSENRIIIQEIHISFYISGKQAVDSIQLDRTILFRQAVVYDPDHPFGYLPIRRRVVILIHAGQSLTQCCQHHHIQPRGILFQQPVPHSCHCDDLSSPQQRFGNVLPVIFIRNPLGDSLLNQFQRIAVLRLTSRIGSRPGLKLCFQSLFLPLHIQFAQPAALTDRVLPVIRRTGVFVRILKAYFLTGLHILHHQFLPFAANKDPVRIVHVQHLVDLERGHVTLG